MFSAHIGEILFAFLHQIQWNNEFSAHVVAIGLVGKFPHGGKLNVDRDENLCCRETYSDYIAVAISYSQIRKFNMELVCRLANLYRWHVVANDYVHKHVACINRNIF